MLQGLAAGDATIVVDVVRIVVVVRGFGCGSSALVIGGNGSPRPDEMVVQRPVHRVLFLSMIVLRGIVQGTARQMMIHLVMVLTIGSTSAHTKNRVHQRQRRLLAHGRLMVKIFILVCSGPFEDHRSHGIVLICCMMMLVRTIHMLPFFAAMLPRASNMMGRIQHTARPVRLRRRVVLLIRRIDVLLLMPLPRTTLRQKIVLLRPLPRPRTRQKIVLLTEQSLR